jgi:hypothetical protein
MRAYVAASPFLLLNMKFGQSSSARRKNFDLSGNSRKRANEK